MNRMNDRVTRLEQASGAGFEVVLMTMEPDLWATDHDAECKSVEVFWTYGSSKIERQRQEPLEVFKHRADHEALTAARLAYSGPIYLEPSTRRL